MHQYADIGSNHFSTCVTQQLQLLGQLLSALHTLLPGILLIVDSERQDDDAMQPCCQCDTNRHTTQILIGAYTVSSLVLLLITCVSE
jgi:hypothetical protein